MFDAAAVLQLSALPAALLSNLALIAGWEEFWVDVPVVKGYADVSPEWRKLLQAAGLLFSKSLALLTRDLHRRLLVIVDKQKDIVFRKRATKLKRDFRQFILDDLAKGGSAVHALANRPNKSRQHSVDTVLVDGQPSCHPDVVVAQKAKPW